ncbi:MAG: hypothetical protein SynsKO_39420 [Synoicihabitans sp.]
MAKSNPSLGGSISSPKQGHRLAIVVSHPIQYYSPWFRFLAENLTASLKVFYLWDFGISDQTDPDFGRNIKWDLDLLSDYENEFVPNESPRPGTDHFNGLRNPELVPRLQKWSPTAILVFGYGWHSLLTLAFKWRSCPLILRGDNHDLGRDNLPRLREGFRKFALKYLFRQYAAFAAVGKVNREFYRRHGVASEKIFHVPHAIDNDRFSISSSLQQQAWRKKVNLSESDVVFLFAGKLEPKKQPLFLGSAFNKAKIPHTSLVFVGDGVQSEEVDKLCSIHSNIHRLGFQNQTQMPTVLGAVDCVILPSLGPGETWGLIVNEALACGTPAIVSSHVGCAGDLVKPDITGWIFPAGNESALIELLRNASRKLVRRREQFKSATQAHVNSYNYSAATQGLQTLLDRMIHPRQSD